MGPSKIYLCRADCSMLGNISGLKTETCSLKKNAAEQWEITFDVERYTNGNPCGLRQSDYYDSIGTMMRLYLDGEEQAYFVIDSEPAIKGEGLQEIKSVTAHSIECELSALTLKNFKINCGTKDSQEYLATDPNGNFNNVNPYTNLPYEYISLVNYGNPQLSLLHLALQDTGWAVDENIRPEVCNIKKSFDVSGTNIYGFLTNIVSPSASVIFQFDRKHRKVGLVKAENFGEDTGIFVTMRNLMNSFEITSSSNDDLITKLIPTGADNLGIEQVNFGSDYIINLGYFMDALNEYGDYKYVSKELHDKYNLWKNYRETDKVTFNGKQCTRREQYIELTKLYNKTILDINDLKNRVPNDGAVTDYKTFSLEELKLHLNAYNKALVSLITLYKNEYGVTEIGNAPNYTPAPSSAVNIKNTPYWHDYYAYQESVIPQIKEALKMYCQTDSNGNLITDINGHFIEMEFGNPAYYTDPSIVKEVGAYKYEWSLYGLDELESKKKAWCEAANLLFNECFIKSGTIATPTAYRTADDNGWNSLSDAQKKEFTSKSAYINKLNQYLDYMSFDARNNSLTKNNCKGIIRQCDDAIISRKNEIASIENLQENYQAQRKELADSVDIKKFKAKGILLFTEKDLDIINSMVREQDYNNPNIITTNLDDIVTAIDAQEELYQAAVEELHKLSQPQYSFNTEMDNLYALEEFQCYHDSFKVGNFIRAGFGIHEELSDNEFIKLRLMSITYNPLAMSSQDISVEFSTMVKGLDGVSDLASLLGENSPSSRGVSSGSPSSGGTYGNNDANVQMSNNMVNALLSTELFGTAVTDVILDSVKANRGNFNTLLSHSGIFGSLEAGRIKVSGECLFDYIKSSNHDASHGSFMDLKDGTFSFGAGALKWDGKNLMIDGYPSDGELGEVIGGLDALGVKVTSNINALKGLSTGATKISSGCLSTQNIISDNYNGNASDWLGNTAGSILKLSDGTFSFGGGKLKWDKNKLTINGEGEFTGNITANTLTANKSGTIAGWTFSQDGFYKNKPGLASQASMYLGKDGISLNDYFVASQDGIYFKSKGFSSAQYGTETAKIYSDSKSYRTDGFLGGDCKYIRVYLHNVGDIENYNLSFEYQYGTRVNVHDSASGSSYYIYEDTYTLYRIRGWGTGGRTEMVKSIIENDGDDIRIMELPISDAFHENGHQAKALIKFRAYSYGRAINGKWFDAVQIGKIELCGEDWAVQETLDGDLISPRTGLMFNTHTQHFFSDSFHLGDDYFSHRDIYGSTASGSANVAVDSSGRLHRTASSSKRYKADVTPDLPDSLSPQKIYDLSICSYKYKDGYLPPDDQHHGRDVIGFIAEDIFEKYPAACMLDSQGRPEMWDINILFPALTKLVQEQHGETEAMKQRLQELELRINGRSQPHGKEGI